MPNLHSSWKDLLLDHSISENGVAGNLSMEEFFDATAESLGKDQIIRNLTDDENGVWLAIVGDEKELKILHHPKNFGGKLTRKQHKVVVLDGLNHEAKAILIDPDSISSFQPKQAPDAEELMDKMMEDEFSSIQTTQANKSNFLPAILLPPFIITALLDMDISSTSPFELIPTIAALAGNWDENHAEDENCHVRAKSAVAPLLRWLFVAGKKKMDGVSYEEIGNEDEESISYLKRLSKTYIIPPLGSNSSPKTPNSLLVSTLSRIGDNLDFAVKLKAKDHIREEGKKDRLKDAHPSFVRMLLNFGSIDGVFPLEEIPATAKQFFNSKSVGLADQTLNEYFRDDGIHDCGFSEGLTTSLYHFNLLWENSIHPKNLSIFSFHTLSPDDTDQSSRFVVMHLQDKAGIGMKTSDDVKKATKQTIYIPISYQELLDRLKFFKTIIKVFGGEEGKNIEKWNDLIKGVKTNSQAFKAMASSNPKFIPSFAYKVDKRFFEYLSESRANADREMVNDNLLDFQHLVESVKLNDFNSYLPASFFPEDPKKRKAAEVESETEPPSGGGGRPGKPGKPGKQEKSKAENKGFIEDFKLSNDEYEKVKGNMSVLALRPKWDSKKFMCHRFHSRGYCYGSCGNSASHVDTSSVSEALRNQYARFVEEARKCT